MRSHSTMSVLVLALGCGDPPVDSTIAQAVRTENKTETAQKQLEETRLKQIAEKKAAKEEKARKKEAELEAATRLPDPVPSTLQAACDALVKSYGEFMMNGSEEDVLDWVYGKGQKLGIVRDKCERAKNIQSAACASVALQQKFETLGDLKRVDAAKLLLSRCAEKFSRV